MCEEGVNLHKLKQNYVSLENLLLVCSCCRPAGLAWEVRKPVSPRKYHLAPPPHSACSHPRVSRRCKDDDVEGGERTCSSSARILDFESVEQKVSGNERSSMEHGYSRESPSTSAADSDTVNRGGRGSWADRVKGLAQQPSSPSLSLSPQPGCSAGQEKRKLFPPEAEESLSTLLAPSDEDGEWERVTRHRSRQHPHNNYNGGNSRRTANGSSPYSAKPGKRNSETSLLESSGQPQGHGGVKERSELQSTPSDHSPLEQVRCEWGGVGGLVCGWVSGRWNHNTMFLSCTNQMCLIHVHVYSTCT